MTNFIKTFNNSLLLEKRSDSLAKLSKDVLSTFKDKLQSKDKLQIFINNEILIDEVFLTFAKNNNIVIKQLFNESMMKWSDEIKNEEFYQGVFLVSSSDLEFILATLFYKGTGFEDQLGTFIIVNDDNINKLIELKKKYLLFSREVDHFNCTIKVFDSNDIAYQKNSKWEDLFLPDELKTDIKSLVEVFLKSKDFYLENRIPWKRGIILSGEPGNGKSTLIKTIISNYNFKPVTIVPEANNDMLRSAFLYAEHQSPSLLYFEDLDSLFERGLDLSTFLNLMDGIQTRNGMLVIATANDLTSFKSNVIDRPSRFDRKIEIPLPDAKQATKYLKSLFKDSLSEKDLKNIVKICVKNKLSYAYLKEIYISTKYVLISEDRKDLKIDDVNEVINKLLQERVTNLKSVNTDKYLQ